MVKKHRKTGKRSGLQAITLCISTALVLILLGLVVLTTLAVNNSREVGMSCRLAIAGKRKHIGDLPF